MSRLRWLAIANPGAGRPGATERAAAELVREGLACRAAAGRGHGDLARIASEAGDVDGIVSIGGDGTTLDILEGLDLGRHALALLPLGHGNCLARDLGLARPAAALRALRGASAASLREIDLLDVTLKDVRGAESRRLAASFLACGYVADVAATGRRRLPGLGLAAYAAASVVTRPRPVAGSLALDGRAIAIAGCTGVAVNNTAHLANFRALPDARLDDARLDVMGFAAGWARQVAHDACIIVGSTLVRAALVTQAASAHLAFDGPETITIDGELVDDVVQAEVRVRPRALRVLGGA